MHLLVLLLLTVSNAFPMKDQEQRSDLSGPELNESILPHHYFPTRTLVVEQVFKMPYFNFLFYLAITLFLVLVVLGIVVVGILLWQLIWPSDDKADLTMASPNFAVTLPFYSKHDPISNIPLSYTPPNMVQSNRREFTEQPLHPRVMI